MQLFEDLIKCKDCMNNINNKCILYPGKDTKEENTSFCLLFLSIPT